MSAFKALTRDENRNVRVAVIAAGSATNEFGGAERFYVGLRAALERAGADAEIVTVINDESDFHAIEETYLRYYDLDLSRFDAVISTKAPGYVVRHPNHVCYLQHTMRVFYDNFDVEFRSPSRELLEQRRQVQRWDSAALEFPRTRARFVIGHEVRERLLKYNGLDSQVLYQASTLSGFHSRRFEYVLLPGRLHRWKRPDLVIEAFRHVRSDIELLITGIGENEAEYRALAGSDRRIRFLGRVSDEELLELYADALVVPFVALREDFGLITLEAFHSGKPVITCTDSGEPSRIVRHGQSGFVCAPDPLELAGHIDRLAQAPDLARSMGDAGRRSVEDVRWDVVGSTLMDAIR